MKDIIFDYGKCCYSCTHLNCYSVDESDPDADFKCMEFSKKSGMNLAAAKSSGCRKWEIVDEESIKIIKWAQGEMI